MLKLVERLRRRNRERLARRHARTRLLESIAANETAILDALLFLLKTAREQQRVRAAADERLARLEEGLAGLRTALADLREREPVRLERTTRGALVEPEADLLVHLAPALPHRTALDIGANVGDVSAALLDAGLAVHAFEPAPATFQALRSRLGARPGFVAHGFAVGREDGPGQLHLARDLSGGRFDASLFSSLVPHATLAELPFGEAVPVQVRSLESLHRSGEIPADVGVVKIDTEGLDLEVIRGMGDRAYPVVMAEFWDRECEFARAGSQNLLDDVVPEMRRRGYAWHLVLYRVWGRNDAVGWYCNRAGSIERSWGNALFFRDRALFRRAVRWCAAELPRARFVRADGST